MGIFIYAYLFTRQPEYLRVVASLANWTARWHCLLDPGAFRYAFLHCRPATPPLPSPYTLLLCSAASDGGNMLICDWLIANRRPSHCYLLTATIDQRRRRVTQYRWKLTLSHRLSVFHFARHVSAHSFHSRFDSTEMKLYNYLYWKHSSRQYR